MRFVFLSSILTLLLVGGCAPQNLNAEQTRAIQHIALAGPENPQQYSLKVGDIGSAIAMGVGVSPSAATYTFNSASPAQGKSFSDLLKDQKLALGEELAEGVKAALLRNGYSVSTVTIQRPQPADLAGRYDNTNSTADVLLDMAIESSSYERRMWGKIGPSLLVTARLIDLHTSRRLFERTYRYDFHASTMGYVILRPAEKYGFDEVGEVLSHPDVAAEGLRAAIPMISNDIALQLRK